MTRNPHSPAAQIIDFSSIVSAALADLLLTWSYTRRSKEGP